MTSSPYFIFWGTARSHCLLANKATMAQQFFEKLSNDVLEATEQIADRMEEGIKLMFAGEGSTNSPTPTPDTGDFTIEEELDDLKEDGLGDTPLRGIAEEQLKNIMENNVRNNTAPRPCFASVSSPDASSFPR